MSTTTVGGESAWDASDDGMEARSRLKAGPDPAGGQLPPARSLLEICTATVLRCGQKTAVDAPDWGLTYGELSDAATAVAGRLQALGIGPGDRAGVQVTSGTAELYIDAEAQLWLLDVEDRVLAGLSVSFDASCEEMWLAWRHGATLVPAPRSHRQIRSRARLLDRGLRDHGRVDRADRCRDVGGRVARGRATVDPGRRGVPGQPRLAARRGPGGVEHLRPDRDHRRQHGADLAGPAGHDRLPLSGWHVAVVGEHGEPVPLGEDGELVVAGVGVARYLDPALDAERFAALPALGWTRRTGRAA